MKPKLILEYRMLRGAHLLCGYIQFSKHNFSSWFLSKTGGFETLKVYQGIFIHREREILEIVEKINDCALIRKDLDFEDILRIDLISDFDDLKKAKNRSKK